MSFKIKVKWDGEKAQKALANATPRGLYEAGQVVARDSGQQVPLDTGDLLRSQAVTVEGQTVTISYDTPYAIRWHEQDANFQRGRKKKYLEDPINDKDTQRRALEALARNVRLE